jgi:DNA topoisomerase II
MNTVKVTIDREKNEISVWNNGKGIPIELHKEENIMIPTLIFGHLLTGSNFDDNIKKVTGGRNGYGAKLCNIFSEKFTVETVNSETKKKFVQTWKNNMSVAGEAKVEKLSRQPKEDYTQITFRPDFKRFGMDALDQDIVDLISKRVVDLSGTTSEDVKVFLNGKKIPVKSFKDYIKLYTGDKKIAYCEANERWKSKN